MSNISFFFTFPPKLLILAIYILDIVKRIEQGSLSFPINELFVHYIFRATYNVRAIILPIGYVVSIRLSGNSC